MSWISAAFLAALFARVDSNLATAIRTCVVPVMAWWIVAARGKLSSARAVRPREALFLVASGIATGHHGCSSTMRSKRGR